MRTWIWVPLAAALSLACLGVAILTGLGGGRPPQGESLPQLTDPPGPSPHGGAIWGTPDPERYTPLDSPTYVEAGQASAFLGDQDPVYLLRKGGATYVFPEVLLTSYHVVNDVVEGEPVAVTFCLLAGSATLFSRRIGDQVLTLGVNGELYCGNSVLCDRETGTKWLQLNGEPLSGRYLGRARLPAWPLERSTWRRLKHSGSLRVLAPEAGMEEYRDFHRDMLVARLGQRVVESRGTLDPRLLPYTKGLGILVQGEPRFYPLDPRRQARAHNDQVGGWAVLVLQGPDEESSRVFRRRHQDRLLDFELRDGRLHDRQTGSRWDDRGICVEGPLAGAALESPFFTHLYWFVWAALYPRTGLS